MNALSRLQSLKRWQLGLLGVVLSLVLAEAVVCGMAWLLLGHVPAEFLITGFVAAVLVASVVLNLVDHILRAMADKQLQIQLQLQNVIFETTPLGVLTTDRALRVTRVNPVLQQWLGPALLLQSGCTLAQLIHPDDRDDATQALQRLSDQPGNLVLHDRRVLRQDGRFFWADLALSSLAGLQDEVVSLLAIVTDITPRRAAEEEINQLAFYDALTGLPNRRLMMDRLTHALNISDQSAQRGAVMFIDLDNFRTINDTRGHEIGDLLLQRVARRLASCLRGQDTLARLGGDEFVVILEDLGEVPDEAARQAKTVAENILLALGQPYNLNTNSYRSSASVGITLFLGRADSEEELLKRADIAMYQSKAGGRNTLRFFEPAMQQVIADHATLETSLRTALNQDQFECYFQVQTLHSNKIIGAEVLLRWNHPEQGVILPETFVSLAEHNGLILPIGQWVLEKACAQLQAWSADEDMRHLQLAINVSPVQFHQPDFVQLVTGVLHRYGVKPGRLKLELTESLVLNDVADTIDKMQQLRAADMRFSIDDFGTGYSSLAYLTQLPLDQLKIDQSFVRNIGVTKGDSVIVETIIDMAHNLGLDVIAEGVETEPQRAFLEFHGCASFQGYLVGRPVNLEEFETLVRHPAPQTPALI